MDGGYLGMYEVMMPSFKDGAPNLRREALRARRGGGGQVCMWGGVLFHVPEGLVGDSGGGVLPVVGVRQVGGFWPGLFEPYLAFNCC